MSGPRTFPPDATAVRDVRRFVDAEVTDLPSEQRELIALATSELAANAVRHARTEFVVTVERTDDEVRVAIEDGGHGRPELQDPEPDTPSGRGLLIVEQLADRWGVGRVGDHNRVWFAFSIPDSSPQPSSSIRAAEPADHPPGTRHHRAGRPANRPPRRCPGGWSQNARLVPARS